MNTNLIDLSRPNFDLSEVSDLTVNTVAVMGLGSVGLPTALAFAAKGTSVIGIDISAERLALIREARVDLLPADITRLGWALEQPDFILTDDPGALSFASAILICVPTPVDAHFAPDLDLLRHACAVAVAHAVAGQTIVLTSTSYVGTTRELLIDPLEQRGLRAGRDVFVAFSPERIDPGNAVNPQQSVPRVVGGATPTCCRHAESLFSGVAAYVHTVSSPETAELTKLYENTFRAVNIALANELADISSALGVEAVEVIRAASTKPYGFMPFYPGPGAGGHCIPCDPHYLLWQLRAERVRAPLIEQAMDSIAARPARVVARASEVLSADGLGLAGARVLVVGVAYKPGVEDVRGSPATEIIARLVSHRAKVFYTDALVPSLRLKGGETIKSRVRAEFERWDLVVVHTDHPGTDLTWLRSCPRVLDATYRLVSMPHCSVV